MIQNIKYNIFYTDDDVDDQEFFREIVSEINSGHTIYTQNHGDELLNALQNPPPSPHLVFLDLNMPRKNGYEVLKELKEINKEKQVPVIIFSTSNDETAIQKTRDLGASLYITKPTSYTEFKKIIDSVLSLNWTEYSPEPADFVFRIN